MNTEYSTTIPAIVDIEQMLEDRIFELNQFVYHVSHDLMAPLCRMQGLLNLIISERPVGHHDHLDRIKQCIDQLSNFTRNTLAYSENLNVAPRPEKIPVKALVQKVFQKYKTIYPDSGMTLKLELDTNTILSDARRWNNILEILFSNAFQFRDERKNESVIHITLSKHRDLLKFNFHDNGVGIPNSLLNQVKDIFVRGENSQGNGLGLYVLHQIAENLGGEISIDSQLGSGTKIQLHIPVIRPISSHKAHKTRSYTDVTTSAF